MLRRTRSASVTAAESDVSGRMNANSSPPYLRDDVYAAAYVVEHLGYAPEDIVAEEVAEPVVSVLEVVDVEHQYREPPAAPGHAGELLLEPLEEVPAVVQARAGVDARQLLKARIRRDERIVKGLDAQEALEPRRQQHRVERRP